MLLDYPLNCPTCGKKPELIKNKYNYVRYSCVHCNLNSFHHRLEEFTREAWNAMIIRFDQLKVRI
jgi:transposase-like protein